MQTYLEQRGRKDDVVEHADGVALHEDQDRARAARKAVAGVVARRRGVAVRDAVHQANGIGGQQVRLRVDDVRFVQRRENARPEGAPSHADLGRLELYF